MSATDELQRLFEELQVKLDQMVEVQRDVVEAVRTDNLTALGECMKREQAFSLTLRNIDQQRIKLQKALGLEQCSLEQMIARASEEQQGSALRACADKVKASYTTLKSEMKKARSSLERGLHEVESIISRSGLDPKQIAERDTLTGGAHTDFHA